MPDETSCQLHSNELVLREVFQNLDGKTSGPGSFTGPLGKAAGCSVHRLSPVKFRPVSGPGLELPDNIIADLSSDQLLPYQLTRAVRTGNVSANSSGGTPSIKGGGGLPTFGPILSMQCP